MKRKLFTSLTLLMLLLVACGGAPGDDPAANPEPVMPTRSDDTPVPVPEEAEDGKTTYIYGEATVEDVQVNVLESFPVQVRLMVSGFLSDGCTEIDETAVARSDNSFDVNVATRRPADAICTQQLVSFEENVALDVVGLPAGEYTVDVNGTIVSFTLDVDNVPPAED